ncbi:NAD-dependent epimerase/dehydratase family protein [Cohaesibacter haloalkalitolerans]|uniref:NAD-dependent epimerase/dehydratase family protein n=1 Tax=Cohaesibacter haloalkalitolerans TaxID=1162980 RepID=UPI0013C45EC4|nr:NAD-dependent epimerase/dehydratase family protein [Cohaesibacter haloalkalitolerans]
MRIFVTGGTGLVGRAIVKAFVARGDEVTTLARSERSAEIQSELGATPVPGSLTDPGDWVNLALTHDAFIHTAATFDNDMANVDQNLVSALVNIARDLPEDRLIPFLYTGGCWLYPEEPVIPITERHVLDPTPEFEWMLDSIERLNACPNFQLTVIHPGLVVDKGRGIIANFAEDLKENGEITIVGSTDTHFPFVHADDLAQLYVLAVDNRADGLLLNASTIKSATAGEVGKLVAQSLGLPYQANVITIEEAQERFGAWASAYARSQRMSSDRARATLGWAPLYDTIEEMVRDSLVTEA